MNLLVIGGAGYIGSHVLNLLGEEGHDIVVVDNLSTGRKESILYVHTRKCRNGKKFGIKGSDVKIYIKRKAVFNDGCC